MISYLVKVIASSGLLWFEYVFCLETEKMHQFKRFFLLSSLVFSLIVPFIAFPLANDNATIPVLENPVSEFYRQAENVSPGLAGTVDNLRKNDDLLITLLIALYCIVTFYFLVRFAISIYRLYRKAAGQRCIYYKNARLVFLDEDTTTHTFFNTIFVGKKDYTGQTVVKEILLHELTHVQQKHSIDVVFIELLRAIFWFNPIFLLYKKAIQLNHEFLADRAVINEYKDIPAYQYLLLNRISQHSNSHLSSNLNFFITKKRLTMMAQKRNAWITACSLYSLSILLAATFFLFCEKAVAQVRKDTATLRTDILPKVTFPGTAGKGVSEELFNEYQKAVQGAYKRENAKQPYYRIDVTGLDLERLRSIYDNMSTEQRKKATRLLGYIPLLPPPPRKSPTQQQLQSWQNPAVYGVWLNGRKVSNTVLAKYKASDFDWFMVSKLYGAAKENKTYSYQVDLMTPDYYEASFLKNQEQK